MLRGHAPEQCSMRGCCGLQYLVEADGSVYPCDFYGLDEYRLGNIRDDAWEDLDRARESLGFIEASRRIPEKCGQCQWYPLCRNGCRRDRVLEEKNWGAAIIARPMPVFSHTPFPGWAGRRFCCGVSKLCEQLR